MEGEHLSQYMGRNDWIRLLFLVKFCDLFGVRLGLPRSNFP